MGRIEPAVEVSAVAQPGMMPRDDRRNQPPEQSRVERRAHPCPGDGMVAVRPLAAQIGWTSAEALPMSCRSPAARAVSAQPKEFAKAAALAATAAR
ncbi:hypothetical protein SAMN04488125_104257 [Methylorubrum salsuginis]|uniref:Uncharacterized protein n=1 Tax=Methylorubrum salsuginis TaxID=414703 RepID=A0A1I4CLM3_9HYPH|nr:hypothetical protein [Methylorubrum salsuginis]SFK81653.1 hypothetical protein SAMN04488125_104257 [Methylorubrum salsuginis]